MLILIKINCRITFAFDLYDEIAFISLTAFSYDASKSLGKDADAFYSMSYHILCLCTFLIYFYLVYSYLSVICLLVSFMVFNFILFSCVKHQFYSEFYLRFMTWVNSPTTFINCKGYACIIYNYDLLFLPVCLKD